MFRFLCKQLLIVRTRVPLTTTRPHFWFLQTQSLKSVSESTNEKSPTVPYLVNSFGFSLESATKVSRKIKIKSFKEADAVVELFRKHGFSYAQITDFVTKRPSLLVIANPEQTLKSKFEFFKSLGISDPELAKMISRCPSLLSRDLENQIIPSCHFIKTFVHSDEKLVTVLKRYPIILLCNVEEVISPNILMLRTYGIPEPNISMLISSHPLALMRKPVSLEVAILKAKNLGFNPESKGFLSSVEMLALSESTWEKKMVAYKNFGLSEGEFFLAFKLQPLFVKSSEKKIKKLMDFFVKKLGWSASVLSKYPNLMILSLERRIIPRCSVLQILFSKGILLKKDVNIPSELNKSGKFFLTKFVTKYQDKIPELMDAQQGRIVFTGFHNESKDASE
ncbi:hypothetical protein GIB67_011132 [Kingdonia uniflora]|uniref:Uncharacterized protein n=1 Tax=Kingdonia uniflora TaxID=39325 RepID=A0A7J7PAG1_9MAGN|nr:hypothetical protein GIB67_011132 [Kingdonia uniflora]